MNDWKKQPHEKPVTIICGNKKIVLDNKSNWIFTAIDNYLKNRLKNIDSVESATEELETKYSIKGGKKMNIYQSIFMFGIDCLYRNMTNTDEITNEMCSLIRDYLKYIGEPISEDDFDDPDTIKNIRSRIRYLRKSEYKPVWEIANIDSDFPFRSSYW